MLLKIIYHMLSLLVFYCILLPIIKLWTAAVATIEKREAQDKSVTYRVKIRIKGFPAQTASFERLYSSGSVMRTYQKRTQ